MCDYTQVEYACGHLRYLVRSWCVRYQETHKRCQPNVVAIEHRLEERCSDCRDPPKPKYTIAKHTVKLSAPEEDKNKNSEPSTSTVPEEQARRGS